MKFLNQKLANYMKFLKADNSDILKIPNWQILGHFIADNSDIFENSKLANSLTVWKSEILLTFWKSESLKSKNLKNENFQTTKVL